MWKMNKRSKLCANVFIVSARCQRLLLYVWSRLLRALRVSMGHSFDRLPNY